MTDWRVVEAQHDLQRLRKQAEEATARRVRNYAKAFPEESAFAISKAFGLRPDKVRRILKERRDQGEAAPG